MPSMIRSLEEFLIAPVSHSFLGADAIVPFFIITALQGFPLAGALYFVDLLISDIIDEDEIKTGVRREGSYYGMNAFVHRFSVILKVSVIAIVFTNVDWYSYVPTPSDPALVAWGLKTLMVFFPIAALGIAMLIFKFYPLEGEKLAAMRQKLEEIHLEKQKKVNPE